MVENRQNKWLLQTSTSIVLQQCQTKVTFQRNDSGIVLKFSQHFLKDRKCSLIKRKHCQPFKITRNNFNPMPEPFLWKLIYLILTLLENNRSAVFEATTYFAFTLP